MTRGAHRVRSATGARCEFPGCGARASSTTKPATITVSGRPMTVERLCAEHRRALSRLPARRRTPQQPRSSEGPARVRYRCPGCGQTHETYNATERCSDAHRDGGGRIAAVTEEDR